MAARRGGLVQARLMATSSGKADNKALRVVRVEEKVGKLLRVFEKTKETSYMAFGAAGCVLVVAVGGLLVYKSVSGSSEYVVYNKAIALLRQHETVKTEFGQDIHFFGERSEGTRGGHHAGLVHVSEINPATGERHVKVVFHFHANEDRGDVTAEMYKKRQLLLDTWEFRELTMEWKHKGKGRTRRLHVIAPQSSGAAGSSGGKKRDEGLLGLNPLRNRTKSSD